MTSDSNKRVVILQRVLPHYRIPFVSRLRQTLAESGFDLRLIYGQEKRGSLPATVELDEPWALRITNRYLPTPAGEFVWQPCWRSLPHADLLIVEQANRLLINYLLQWYWRREGRVLAYWGHGRDFQAGDRNGVSARLRSLMNSRVDWWFAYTRLSAAIVAADGFPRERISIVGNSIDTNALKRTIAAVNAGQIRALREQLRLEAGPVALYCGGLYPEKKIAYLLEAAGRLRQRIEHFNLILVGSGPEEAAVGRAAAGCSWIHHIGADYGVQRAVCFALSDVMLMPGAVGLAIVDSFAAGVPLFTTDTPGHGPEIAYLESGGNGVMTSPAVEEYVATVAGYLAAPERLAMLRQGCQASAERITLEAMTRNFSAGIMAALARRA